MQRLSHYRPNPALAVAVLALSAALAGTAVADQATTSKVTPKKVREVARQEAKKQINKQAVRGPVHYVSETGRVSPPQPGEFESVQSESANCPDGTAVIGGGVKIVTNAFTAPIDSYPTATGWTGTVFQGQNPNTGTFIITAICASVKATSGAPAS